MYNTFDFEIAQGPTDILGFMEARKINMFQIKWM